MKTFIKIGLVVMGITAMSSCGLFDSNEQANDSVDETTIVPIDTIQKIDTTAEDPAKDSNAVEKEEGKE